MPIASSKLVLLLSAVVACIIGTWIGFQLGGLFAHQGGASLILAFILLLPYLLLLAVMEKNTFFWILFAALQLGYYFLVIWSITIFVGRMKRSFRTTRLEK